MTAIFQPIPTFNGLDGLPLDNGSIYVGQAGLDARTNPITAYRDQAMTIPWTQPIRTVAGFPAYQGAPSPIYCASSPFSLTTLQNDGQVVLNLASVPGFGSAREKLTANRTYYVRSDGSDSNSGLANTAGGAFLTIQKAIDVAYSLDLGGYGVTVQVGDGTYTGGLKLYGPLIGAENSDGRPLQIIGNEGTPANVVLSVTSDNAVALYNAAYVFLAGIEFRTTSSGYGWLPSGNSLIEHRNCRFGAVAQEMILSLSGSIVRAVGATTVAGNAASFCHATKRSLIDFDSQTITFSGSPVFSTYLWGVNDATINLSGATLTGTVTGGITVHLNGLLNATAITGSYLGGSAPVVDDSGYIATSLIQNALFYVRSDGSDQNDGLANSAARAFLTLNGALNAMQRIPPDPITQGAGGGIRAAAINVGAGTYTAQVTLRDIPAFSVINIVGDETTPANVHINVTGSCFTADGIKTAFNIRGMRLSASGGNCIASQRGSLVSFQKCEFNTAAVHILAETGGQVRATGNYSIVGAASFHVIQRYGSIVDIPNAVVTITGTPAFTTFHFCESSLARWTGSSFSGSATGTRYDVRLNGVINTGGLTLPGNVAGSTATGGQYA
jgi:hypothetical protein